VKLSVGFASVEIGGTIGVALEFVANHGFSIADGWVNGSIFVKASALFWSDSWNLVSGSIYSWTDPDGVQVPSAVPLVGYNNGTATNWSLASRYYAGTGYDAVVWDPNGSTGPAVSDIYPETEVTATVSPSGTVVFYTNDDLAEPVQQGLAVAGFSVSSASNALAGIPAPSDPGYEISGPVATTLPNGSAYVLWSALPQAETSDPTPLDLSTLDLHGAAYDPTSRTWGAVHQWTAGRIIQSYALDASDGAPRVVTLTSDSFLVGPTTPEYLAEFNLTSGALLSSSLVTGIASLVSLRAAAGTVLVRGADGIYSNLNLASGTNASLPNAGPSGGFLVSATYADSSDSTLILLYRGINDSDMVVYDSASGSSLGTLPLGTDAFEAEGVASGATVYAFVRTSTGILGWSEVGGVFTPLASIAELNVTSYGLAQIGGGILVYSLTSSGDASEPTVTLELAEVDAELPIPRFSSASGSVTSSSGAETALVLLAAGAGAVALLLGVVAVVSRRRPPARPPEGATGGPPASVVPGGPSPPSTPPGERP
jgi:hypothetical protein